MNAEQNPLKAGPVRYEPERLAELQAERDKVNADLKAGAMESGKTVVTKMIHPDATPPAPRAEKYRQTTPGDDSRTTVTRMNWQPGVDTTPPASHCPQCHDFFIQMDGIMRCASCGLPQGQPVEMDRRQLGIGY